MNKTDRERQTLFDAGLYMIANSDKNLETKRLQEAIAELQAMIYVRENMPF